jgi:beta-lactamase regulating signal transducer with metallopeptidase domain
MTGFLRLMLPCAATIAVAAALPAIAPARAAENTVTVNEAVAKTAPSAAKRRASPAGRIAISHYRSNMDCSGEWCGRQFVLMIGVAY